VDENDFGVPAGWYPDPLGLPQLRWWDAQAWTEHTSEARAPIVIQRTAYEDSELPSRREQRERERREHGDVLQAELDTETSGADFVNDELSAQPLLAMTLRELEPPVGDTLDDFTPGPKRASAHTNAAPAASTLSALAEDLPPARAIKTMPTYTGASWLIALMPAFQLLGFVLTVAFLGHNLPLMLAIVFAPYLVVVGFAFYDRLLLQVWGHSRPASAFWSFLLEPAYLIARAVSTIRETGKGFAPIALLGSSLVALFVGVLVMPGIAIGLAPDQFANEVERSVQADAAALGADITLECPAPPLVIGEVFSCIATKPSGETDSIAVSLQRQNGWITWQVEDWGLWVLTD